MARWVYVDESKRAGYVLAAVEVTEPETARRVLRELVLPGQRRLHMKHEQPRRRAAIVSRVAALPIEVRVYDAGRRFRTDLEARAACLAALVDDLPHDEVRLLIETDETLVHWDRQRLYELARQAGMTQSLAYEHRRAHEEPLLALPDIAAWCWARSSEWRRRIGPVLRDGRHVGGR